MSTQVARQASKTMEACAKGRRLLAVTELNRIGGVRSRRTARCGRSFQPGFRCWWHNRASPSQGGQRKYCRGGGSTGRITLPTPRRRPGLVRDYRDLAPHRDRVARFAAVGTASAGLSTRSSGSISGVAELWLSATLATRLPDTNNWSSGHHHPVCVGCACALGTAEWRLPWSSGTTSTSTE